MTKRLWSINGLATELEHDRRTVARSLRGIRPDGEIAGHPAWFLDTALSVLSVKQKDVQEDFDPNWPKAYKASADKCDFFGGLCVMSTMRMVYAAPAIAAVMAVSAGASAATAYRLKDILTVALMGHAEKTLKDMGVEPYSNGADLLWDMGAFDDANWAYLASVTGEAHDEAAWREAAMRANQEQGLSSHPEK